MVIVLTSQFHSFKNNFKKAINKGLPMDLRLFLFLLVLVLTMLIGVIAILFVSGTFSAGLSQSEKLVQNDLNYLSNSISEQFGLISQHAVEFSKSLSSRIETQLQENGYTTFDLQEHPELLKGLLSLEFESTLSSVLRSNSSGGFIVLDATINPALANAENYKAGLYIKNMEPNIINSSSPNIHILRGHPRIARINSLPLHAQWDMEFNIMDAIYYHRPLQKAKDLVGEGSLSEFYYWTPPFIMPGTSEEVMLCSVPLIDSNGNVFGVCGLEISGMLFKLSYMPNNSIYNSSFSMLFLPEDGNIHTNRAFIAGGYSIRSSSKGLDNLKIIKSKKFFFSYQADEENSFLGLHTPIKMYPEGSAFSDDQWMVGIMIHKEDIVKSIFRLNFILSSLLILLLTAGIILSFFLSRKYIRPIFHGFDIIKSKKIHEHGNVKIPEINDLIEFLSTNENILEEANREQIPIPLLEEFVNNTKDLSPAERDVFYLYVQGYTAKEIANILSLSINTIKTHNKRIYMKLNVGSRKELLLYINMLKDIGREFQ